MKLFTNKKAATEYMNERGANGFPFLFLIDFEMKKIIIKDDFLPSEEIRYDISGTTNSCYDQLATVRPSFFSKTPITFESYKTGFDLVKSEILFGNSFLLNLTYPTQIDTDVTLEDIYELTNAKYKIWYKDRFVCFSPETFIKIIDGEIRSFPMKGTIDATIPNAADIILNDEKELAEHYTIVDLIRNDLSKVASQVEVRRFRYIDEIRTNGKQLLQVSSEVVGKLEENYNENIGSILFDILPAGSISGAPKQKTTEIITAAERRERGYYTGICGFFDGKNLDSGVMIRFIEKDGDNYIYRSGGGITSKSNAYNEYQEMIDKVYLPIKIISEEKIVTND